MSISTRFLTLHKRLITIRCINNNHICEKLGYDSYNCPQNRDNITEKETKDKLQDNTNTNISQSDQPTDQKGKSEVPTQEHIDKMYDQMKNIPPGCW